MSVRVVILTIIFALYLHCVACFSRIFALRVFNFCDWLMPSTDSRAFQALSVGEYRD